MPLDCGSSSEWNNLFLKDEIDCPRIVLIAIFDGIPTHKEVMSKSRSVGDYNAFNNIIIFKGV